MRIGEDKELGVDLDEWLATLAAEIGLDDVSVDADTLHTLLDLARDSAHNVTRIAAPLTTYLVGVAVGRGAPLGTVAAAATALVAGAAGTEESEPAEDPA